jgi:hypothetical protein
MTTGEQLEPKRDLTVAMTVVADMARLIGAADTKTGLVLATQGVVLAAVLPSSRPSVAVTSSSPSGAVVVLAAAVIVVILLLASLWPRTGGAGPQWFAFSTFRADRTVPPRPDEATLADQAWTQATALASIVHRKLRWFRAALLIGAVELGVFGVWVTLGAVPASTT